MTIPFLSKSTKKQAAACFFCLTLRHQRQNQPIMTQIERITRMEALLDKGTETVRRLEKALDDFAALQPDIDELQAYYDGDDWRADFEADEAGLLPKDLKRGVLSEDGVYDLLEDYQCLKDQIRTIE